MVDTKIYTITKNKLSLIVFLIFLIIILLTTLISNKTTLNTLNLQELNIGIPKKEIDILRKMLGY